MTTLCNEWPYLRVCTLAISMQDQMFPDSKSVAPKQEGFQSGTTEEPTATGKRKTTTISFADMVAKAKAGIDTSIKGI